VVTIFHWDLPDDLDWLDARVVPSFLHYSGFLFKTFPEVKHWITFNEPLSFCPLGYRYGLHAPGVVSEYGHLICGHNVLRAHAGAVELYRRRYQARDKGSIGITLDYMWAYPQNASDLADHRAVQFDRDFNLGWWADPIFLNGDYPASMRAFYGDKLPAFTASEKLALNGSADFFGMNNYGGKYVKWDNATLFAGVLPCAQAAQDRPAGECGASPWLWVNPASIRLQLEYIHARYRPSSIVITENGVDVPGESDLPLDRALKDTFRQEYFRTYLGEVARARLESKVPVRGYFVWSLLDNFEWADGYSSRFGITYVNYTTQERHLKGSAVWLRSVLARVRGS